MRLESVIHRGNILLTGLASLPCPASMLKWRLNAWKQHEMVMWLCKKDRTGRRQRETFPFLSTTHPLFHVPSSCTCVCLSLMLLTSFYMDIFEINEKHCAKSRPYFMFWFFFFPPASLVPSVLAVIGQIQEHKVVMGSSKMFWFLPHCNLKGFFFFFYILHENEQGSNTDISTY